MKYFQTWQDFMRDPANKALKESKGIHACKQKFIQEQNKMQWYDPVMLTEGDAGISVPNNTAAAAGGSSDYIKGHVAETSTFTWTSGINGEFTGSVGNSLQGTYFEVEGLLNQNDYSAGHTETRKTFRLYVVSSSKADFSSDIPAGVVGVVTASFLGIAGANTIATASINTLFRDAINNNAATSVQAGFTNTIAPSTLFTASVSENVLTITNNNAGGVTNILSIVGGSETYNISATASVATTTEGADTWNNEPGAQTFDGNVAPWSNIPRLV